MVPLVAMQVSDEVDWDLTDFVTIGTLLISTGLIYELFVSKVKNKTWRAAFGLALLGALLLIWVELAVGLFTNWGS